MVEGPDLGEQLAEAWRTNNRINLLLLEEISDEGLACTLSKRGGRDVAGQFAHVHTNRVWQLEKRARDLAAGLAKFTAKDRPSRDELVAAFAASGEAVESFLRAVLAGEPKRRGFKKGVFVTLSYLVAHESHHRGNVLLTLKTCGHAVDKAARYRVWDWDRV
ncbi:MAG: DinB family protein [Thermoanaerobaculia bacterium]|nr:DinB family protein [Thermoanaerobaculia bacterium]